MKNEKNDRNLTSINTCHSFRVSLIKFQLKWLNIDIFDNETKLIEMHFNNNLLK